MKHLYIYQQKKCQDNQGCVYNIIISKEYHGKGESRLAVVYKGNGKWASEHGFINKEYDRLIFYEKKDV